MDHLFDEKLRVATQIPVNRMIAHAVGTDPNEISRCAPKKAISRPVRPENVLSIVLSLLNLIRVNRADRVTKDQGNDETGYCHSGLRRDAIVFGMGDEESCYPSGNCSLGKD
tara:strand:- start:599 stop:934 length:336 start_codon:yes stop_codon:yes gene_type:complete